MKGILVFLGAENLHPPDAPIEHMENHSPRRDPCGSRHDRNLAKPSHTRQYMRLSPLSLLHSVLT
jgi:hypothetical protein